MKTFVHLLKVAVLCYALAFVAHATNRILAQRDEMVKIEKATFMLKVKELDETAHVHCDPS